MGRGMNGFTDGRMAFLGQSCGGARGPETTRLPERMKKMPETKARMVLWGRMCPMLLRINPMNMKKRLTRGNGVAERIISDGGHKGTLSASRGLPRSLLGRAFLAVTASGAPEPHLQALPGLRWLGPPRALSLSPWPVESVLIQRELYCKYILEVRTSSGGTRPGGQSYWGQEGLLPEYYGLNDRVPKFICDGIKRWGLWEVLRSRGWGPHTGD